MLVTGSSRGIGQAIALKLASVGWEVAVHGSAPSDDLDDTKTNLGAASAGKYVANLSEPNSVTRLWNAVIADGPVHALVNNAGIYIQQPFSVTDQEYEKASDLMWSVNYHAPIQLMRQAISHFENSGQGSIVNVASRVGFRGEANASIYAATKAAIINTTRSLAVELAPKHIGVFGIAPGWVDTSVMRDGMNERLPEILASIPLGRMASPADCANAVAYLLSSDASYLSGVTLDINGASYFH